MNLVLYGIPACDTMKKARAWLDGHGIAYRFHDHRKDGLARADLERWCAALGWEAVLNRAGTTFRKLPETARANLDAEAAITLMLAQPAMIRRPLLEGPGLLEAGFKPDRYARLLQDGTRL
ncbi:regulatory protein Spx [mine drainage metagenome]|uniref:Regulatory protein Spx n=1 Tax=mine drainage metagenome TaxID=410659 RepID=A0A1J5RED9_9ZZZZ